MKKTILFVFFLNLINLSFSQITFQNISKITKFNSTDSLVDFKIFDYDQDGDDDLFCAFQNGYKSRIVVYNESGDILVNFTHDHDKYILGKATIFQTQSQIYFVEALWKNPDYEETTAVKVMLYNTSNFALLDELEKNSSQEALSADAEVHSLNYFSGSLFLGYYFYLNMPQYADEDYTNILKIGIENDQLIELQSAVNKGSHAIQYNSDTMIGFGIHHDYHFETKNSHGYFYLFPQQNLSLGELVYGVNGMYSYVTNETTTYPLEINFLSENDTCSEQYGALVHFYTIDAPEIFVNRSYGFSGDFSDTLWTTEDTYNSEISTCITAQNGESLIMSFGNILRVRNRLNGEIVYSQTIESIPLFILRNTQGELRFVFKDGNNYNLAKMTEDYALNTISENINNKGRNVTVFPNPSNSAVHFIFENQNEKNTFLYISNCLGQIVDFVDISNMKSYQWIPKQRNTTYFYRISTDQEQEFGKIIVN